MRDKAFEIRGLKPPPIHPPEAPTLLPIEDVSAISWQGSAGASGYTIERAESPDGEWSVVAENVSDADVQYRPLYNDRTAERNHTYSYRIIAVNESGASPPSNTVAAPAVAYHTLVDECRDWEQTYRTKGELLIKYDEARKTKEDAHRFLGQGGDVVFYQCEENIRAFRLYTFLPDKVTDFKISGSSDGNTYTALDVKRTEYYSGEGEYDYDKPVLFSAESIPADILYLKITFPGKAQISRIEIKYGS